ncbi:GNAT family N-acetyltransferase [Companilactobacillus sp.]|jgi:ElaA protein|uniref:GNAT family N-acetyltransferase n=1 Tax=Companilactobacillus sp. TaxID=2767905 RepID=UPI0025BFAE2C|nr:GNAT family N-acetyltransferase [Companilactobacillus sp.]MCH4008708.1 GNAT family N-acetyltransferase [Companilactobacillus sp.]MCH4051113.1 GNAT family N-acetyltransferase [Companilactobacillus sp.]MCH4076651.1 GNAT family N-acetyltransferase [Companilactobacillus sp.]MCH4125226.1 GNAT family N-acetyltransferase [Companilactobacillus sp.]MCH4131766.1 GNAT family N-acetyltransferase [Companilactobacillus sp.]
MIHYVAKFFDQLTTKELWSIYKLRVEIFVVEQKCYYQEVDEDDLKSLHLIGVDDDGNLVTYARLIPEKDHVRIGRVAAAKSVRGNGAGRQLVAQAIICAHDDFPNADQIDIQAQAYLQKFYESMGFTATSDVYLETEIPHLDMILGIDN